MYCVTITDILSLCAIIVTVCMGLLVYNNLAYTKKVACDTATEIARKTVKRMIATPDNLIKESDAAMLFVVATRTTDLDARLTYLERALAVCPNKKTQEKIELLKSVTEEAIKKRDAEFDRDC